MPERILTFRLKVKKYNILNKNDFNLYFDEETRLFALYSGVKLPKNLKADDKVLVSYSDYNNKLQISNITRVPELESKKKSNIINKIYNYFF